MGTRGLTCVVLGGKMKVAQYGQWDHYLGGQGKTVFDFIANKMKLDKFKEAVAECRFLSKASIEKTWTEAGAEPDSFGVTFDVSHKHKLIYPGLNRDTGAQILTLIQDGTHILSIEENGEYKDKTFDVKPVRGLQNSKSFASDSLFCEWAYVLDLDKKTLEIYKGFNKGKAKGRFARMKGHKEYHTINLWAKVAFADCTKETLDTLIERDKKENE